MMDKKCDLRSLPSGIGGLPACSKVMINQTRAIDKIRLIRKLGHVPEPIQKEVDQALKLHYDFS